MPIDQRKADLADWRDETEKQMQETTKAGAAEVSDSDANVRRLALASLENEWKFSNKLLNIHIIQQGGGDPLFGFRIKQKDGSEDDATS